MRRTVVVAAALLCLSPASHALDPIGPPQALLGQGRWGLLAQFSRGQSHEHNPPSVWTRLAETHVQSLQVATGPTYQVREDLSAYGGVFYHLLWGSCESALSQWDLEVDHPFGAFAGLDWRVKKDAHWDVELQYAGATFAMTTGLRWIFD